MPAIKSIEIAELEVSVMPERVETDAASTKTKIKPKRISGKDEINICGIIRSLLGTPFAVGTLVKNSLENEPTKYAPHAITSEKMVEITVPARIAFLFSTQ